MRCVDLAPVAYLIPGRPKTALARPRGGVPAQDALIRLYSDDDDDPLSPCTVSPPPLPSYVRGRDEDKAAPFTAAAATVSTTTTSGRLLV